MAFSLKHILSAPLRRPWNRFYKACGLLHRSQLLHGSCSQSTSARGIQLALSGHNISDYEQERKSYTIQAPEYFNFARDFLDQWAHAEQVSELFFSAVCFSCLLVSVSTIHVDFFDQSASFSSFVW